MEQYPLYAGYALTEVHLRHLRDAVNPGSATVASRISLEQEKDLPELWHDMLETYADALQTKLMAKRGPWIHRFTIGPLRYQRPIDKQTSRVDAAVTGLLFRLVMYFRRFTNGGRLRFMQGESMPDYGEPCYDLAAEFVQAATGEEMGSASQVGYRLEKLLRANPGIGFAGWPL